MENSEYWKTISRVASVAFRQSEKVEAVKSWSISRCRNINMVRKILFVILSLQFLNAAVIANSTIITNGEVNYTAFKNSCIEKGSDGSVNSFWIFLFWKPNYEMVMSFAQFWDI